MLPLPMVSPLHHLIQKICLFFRETKGHSAVEFSFIAPVMIGILFSSIEVTDGVMTNKHVSRASSMLADLTARARDEGEGPRLLETELRDIFRAADQIISGHGIDGATLRVACIERNEEDDGYTVLWSKELKQSSGVMTAPTNAAFAADTNFTQLGDNRILAADEGLIAPGDHLIVAEVRYPFKSSLSNIVFDEFSMRSFEIRLPRSGQTVHLCQSVDQCTDDDD